MEAVAEEQASNGLNNIGTSSSRQDASGIVFYLSQPACIIINLKGDPLGLGSSVVMKSLPEN